MKCRDVMAVALAVAPLTAVAYDSLGSPHPCPEGHLPAICCFEPKRDGFVVTLCGLHSEEWNVVEHEAGGMVSAEDRERDRPRVEYRADAGWTSLPAVPRSEQCRSVPAGASNSEYRSSAPGCPDELVAVLPTVTKREFARLRPHLAREIAEALRTHKAIVKGEGSGRQEVGACVHAGGYVWFGAAFYDSEGYTGVGGLGRFDPRTKKVEIRRPRLLRGISSAALLHDGTWLWLGTYSYSEGGDWPAIGVVRYDWENDRLVPEPDAMCGFLAKGMIQLGNVLWLASDGGLSRRDPSGRWEYLVFREIAPPQLRKVTCPEVYDLARTTVGSDHRPGFDDRLEMFRKQREQVRPGR